MKLRHTLANAKGTSLLEFLVVFPFIMLIFLVCIEFTRAWMTANIVQNAVREGVRVAVVTKATDIPDPIAAGTDRIIRILNLSSLSPVAGPTVTCGGPCVPDATVVASVRVHFDPLFGGFIIQMLGGYDITQTATMRYE